jgi:hypothetical protein
MKLTYIIHNNINDNIVNNDGDDETVNSTPIDVNDLSFEEFRSSLIDHFDILFLRRKLVWPSRLESSHFVYNIRPSNN